MEQTLAQLAGAKVFTKLDANSSFWQIPLSLESAKLTTFITPFGRYSFHRLPFGITSAPEHFQWRMSEILRGLEGVVCMVDDILVLAGAKVFTKLDANSGFWQIPLSPESAKLTTFITPFGRYCFHRLPFGITSAPEHFQRRMSEILRGLEGVVCMVDDILVYGKDQEEHDERLREVLRRLQKSGLTLNKEKCQFRKNRVSFLGQVVDQSGIQPDPEKVTAIQQVPVPRNVSDIRRFLGMANQMSKFAENLAEKTKPLRELLVKDKEWVWNEPQQEAFEEVKVALMTSPILALYDPGYETKASAGAPCQGRGMGVEQTTAGGV